MKAWEIVAWTHDGDAYCVDCAQDAGRPLEEAEQERQEWSPVFASDENLADLVCGECLSRIENTL